MPNYQLSSQDAAIFFDRLENEFPKQQIILNLKNSQLFKQNLFYIVVLEDVLSTALSCCEHFEPGHKKYYISHLKEIIDTYYPLPSISDDSPIIDENGAEVVPKDFVPVSNITFNPPRPEPLLVNLDQNSNSTQPSFLTNVLFSIFNSFKKSPEPINSLLPPLNSPISQNLKSNIVANTVDPNLQLQNSKPADINYDEKDPTNMEAMADDITTHQMNLNNLLTVVEIPSNTEDVSKYYTDLRICTKRSLKDFNLLIPIVSGNSVHCGQMDKIAFQGGKDLIYMTRAIMKTVFADYLEVIELNPQKFQGSRMK